jgi:hypothetical protein
LIQFARAQSQVLRYAVEKSPTVDNLVRQLASPEHNATRWGEQRQDLRDVTSDALRDARREHEADLLKDPNQHVFIRMGMVLPGRFHMQLVQQAGNSVLRHLATLSPHPVLNNFSSTAFGDPDHVNPEDHEDYEPLEKNEARMAHGEYDGFSHWKHHLKDTGRELADHLEQEAEHSGIWDQDDLPEDAGEEFDRLLGHLRDAPFESTHPEHPSYRKIIAQHAED